jgi:uncharacterized protein YcgI (DUF1989 family)
MKIKKSYHIPPQSGIGFSLQQGQLLKVIDPKGEQVSDLMAFSEIDKNEWLSSGRTFDYNDTIYLTTNNILYSNRSNPMFTIVEDKVGVHDFLLTPCSPEMFRKLYKIESYHPSCFENLAKNLAPFGIHEDRISTAFNIFMNVPVKANGKIKVEPPLSRAGDYIILKAEMNLIVALTACSAELSNNGSFKPIDIEILE